MSFWNLSTGEEAKASTSYETPNGDFAPIPKGTNVMAYIDEIKWDEKEGARYISARWKVAKPYGFKNRVLFQNFWVFGNNPNKEGDRQKVDGDRAKLKLLAIDANSGGELATINGVPSDEDLQRCLMNKMMVLRVGLMNEYNYVDAIFDKSKGVSDAPSPAQPRSEPDRVANGTARYDDDIPF